MEKFKVSGCWLNAWHYQLMINISRQHKTNRLRGLWMLSYLNLGCERWAWRFPCRAILFAWSLVKLLWRQLRALRKKKRRWEGGQKVKTLLSNYHHLKLKSKRTQSVMVFSTSTAVCAAVARPPQPAPSRAMAFPLLSVSNVITM